jgi:signal peptidase I
MRRLRRVIWPSFCLASVLLAASGCASGSAQTPGNAGVSMTSGSSQVYRVSSGSMEPTLPIGTSVVVKKGQPTVGAIVIFRPPEGWLQEACGPKPHVVRHGGSACDTPVPKEAKIELIKRVVAGPGDEIDIQRGYVYRRVVGTAGFVRESHPSVRACSTSPECDFPAPIKIRAGHWFLMGDNRGESNDSRSWGPVPTAWVVGVATGQVLRNRHFSRSDAPKS